MTIPTSSDFDLKVQYPLAPSPFRVEEYERIVFTWLREMLAKYSCWNLHEENGTWLVIDDDVLPLVLRHGQMAIRREYPPPSEIMERYDGDYHRARRDIYHITERALELAGPSARERLEQMRSEEGL